MMWLLIPMIMPLMSAAADSSVQVFAVPLTSDIASLLSPLRLAKTSEPPPRLRDFHSLASSFKRTIFIIQGAPSALLKAWLDIESFNICNSIKLHIQRDSTRLSFYFLSSTFVFQFGFSYRLTGMLISRLQQCLTVVVRMRFNTLII